MVLVVVLAMFRVLVKGARRRRRKVEGVGVDVDVEVLMDVIEDEEKNDFMIMIKWIRNHKPGVV